MRLEVDQELCHRLLLGFGFAQLIYESLQKTVSLEYNAVTCTWNVLVRLSRRQLLMEVKLRRQAVLVTC